MILSSISSKIVNSKFTNRWLVLGFDIAVSAAATLATYILIGYFISSTAPISAYARIGVASAFASAVIFSLFGTYKGVLRYTSSNEIIKLCFAIIGKVVFLFVVLMVAKGVVGFTISPDKIFLAEVLDAIVTGCALITIRMIVSFIYNSSISNKRVKKTNVFIYGDSDESITACNSIKNTSYNVVGFIKLTNAVGKHQLAGVKVYSIYDKDFLKHLIEKHNIKAIVFPNQITAVSEKDRIVFYAMSNNLKVLIFSSINEAGDNGKLKAPLREINVEDLLQRDEITIDLAKVQPFLEGKTVMVTGAAGSIGSQLCRLISDFNVEKLIMLDSAETPLHNLMLEMKDKVKSHQHKLEISGREPDNYPDRFAFAIGDVRNPIRMEKLFDRYKPQIIFHAAAYKHVPMMELNPCEAVRANIYGTKIVADNAVRIGAEKMIMISTDKAVNPTNVMGASKRIAEIYVQSLSRAIINGTVNGKTKFITTRFGNVLGSNGSVIPRFKQQIAEGGPVTVTHKDIIRYFMSIPEACRLVLEAATLGNGYEIFVFDMGKPVKIADLASNMIKLAGYQPDVDIKIVYTGLRPGEKLYEELINPKEDSIPTNHKKIFIAKVREFPYEQVSKEIEELLALAKNVEIIGTVKKMKEIVPEYKSRNSIYEQLDKVNS